MKKSVVTRLAALIAGVLLVAACSAGTETQSVSSTPRTKNAALTSADVQLQEQFLTQYAAIPTTTVVPPTTLPRQCNVKYVRSVLTLCRQAKYWMYSWLVSGKRAGFGYGMPDNKNDGFNLAITPWPNASTLVLTVTFQDGVGYSNVQIPVGADRWTEMGIPMTSPTTTVPGRSLPCEIKFSPAGIEWCLPVESYTYALVVNNKLMPLVSESATSTGGDKFTYIRLPQGASEVMLVAKLKKINNGINFLYGIGFIRVQLGVPGLAMTTK